jgi:hypothetical protein
MSGYSILGFQVLRIGIYGYGFPSPILPSLSKTQSPSIAWPMPYLAK